ncbi:MAG: MBL fold metallo-hydrolase [Bacillota bacterium]|nr:MBL fold metallo-hydrolase [Bacillota bacterium]
MPAAKARLRQPSLLRSGTSSVSLFSGSSGNSIHVEGEEAALLVDVGVSCRRLEKALAAVGSHPGSIDGILITHEHSDHVAGLDVFCRRHAVPVYINRRSWAAVSRRLPDPAAIDVRFVEPGESLTIGDLTVRSFPTPHDAAEPVGWRIESRRQTVAVMTDIGCFDDGLFAAVAGADILYIEANYDPEMLRIGPYPWPLKERIRSSHGHLSNEDSADAIARLIRAGSRTFVLSHLSETNNVPELAELTVSRRLQDHGLIQGRDYRLLVAPRYHSGERIGPAFQGQS